MNEKDKALYEFIKGFMVKNQYAPSVRDMVKGLGVASTNTVFIHLNRLAEMGYFIHHGGKYSVKYSVKGVKYVEVSEVPSMESGED